MVLVLLFGVIFIDCRGRHPWRPVYKNIIAFFAGSRGRLPLRVCARLIFLIVGATIGRPSFIKMSLRFARDAEDDVPYRFVRNLIFCS